jgi:putative hydrolase of the HAD superfamily
LDLRFDNWFWLEHLPGLWAQREQMSLADALRVLTPRFAAAKGTLEWYCIDFWSRELALDVRQIKDSVRENVAWIPGAEALLRTLRARGKRLVLVTNAHPETLAIKDAHADLIGHLDAVYSSHPFGAPKESAQFWPAFTRQEPFDCARTLFVDDSLPVLEAARAFGIRWLRAIHRPDSGQPSRPVGDFLGVETIADLL